MKKRRGVQYYVLAFLLILSTAVCSGRKNDEGSPGEAAVPVSAAAPLPAAVQESGDWREAFEFVRDAVQTEPSCFALKTAEGIEWSRSANSLEKALYLAGILEGQGRTVELAEGELDEETTEKLLASIFPAAESFSLNPSAPVSVPSKETELRAAVKRHFWIRMEDGDGWVDLDPSFPGAEPGTALAPAGRTYDPGDEALATRVFIAVEFTAGDSGRPQPVLDWEGPMKELANRALSLGITARFEKAEAKEEEEEESGGGIGGLFGSLSGKKAEERKPASGERAFLTASLTLGDEELAGGEIDPGDEPVNGISLKIKIENLGLTVSESERALYELESEEDKPPLFERHAILITGDRIPAAAWQEDLKSASDADVLAEIKSGLDEIKKSLEKDEVTEDLLETGAGLEKRIGPGLGHLVNMIFASTSDDQTEKEAAALSVAWWYRVPRILIASFSGSEEDSRTVFDLRQDRVEAVVLPGQIRTIKQAFLYGRGVMESTLEGKLLEIFTGRPVLTTAGLLKKAAAAGVPIRMVSALEKDGLADFGIPERVLARIGPALDAGRIIAIPEKSLAWDGRERWGWWDINPRTMETVGVLDSGLHQAMVSRTILEAEGPMQTRMGAVLGAMVGAIDTYWLLSAMILKHGELTKEALEEAKSYMKNIQAVMCPGFERKVGVSMSMTVIDIEDCFKYEIEIFNAEAGVSISQGWCEQFAWGFACASTSILNYYLAQAED